MLKPYRPRAAQSALLLVALAAPVTSHAGVVIQPGWGAPVFRDEFDGNQIDYSKWELGNFSNQANNEQQHYHPDQVLVYDGGLHLWAERDDNWTYGRNYNSGHVRTWQEWSYGRFEVRAKLPYGQGFWPAIWLLPRTATWPQGGEIDIMEARGDRPYGVSSALHWGWDSNSRQYRSQWYESGANFQEGYHDYAVEWEVGVVRFYVDGVNFYTLYEPDVGIPGTPKSLIMNLAVGGDYSGPPDGSTPFPSAFDIDYVRVWQRPDWVAPPTSDIADGGFENDQGALSAWTTFGNDNDNVLSEWGTPQDGERSLKLFGQFTGEENSSGVAQSVAVTPGDLVQVSSQALTRSEDAITGTGNEVFMKIEFYSQFGAANDSEFLLGESLALIGDAFMAQDQWALHDLAAVAPAGAVEARLAFVFNQPGSNDNGSIFIDSATLAVTLGRLDGDINDDGFVDLLDFDLLAQNYGSSTSAGAAAGDFNNDGVVNLLDFNIFATNFGSSLPASVPEPATAALLGLAPATLGRRRRH
ncbi:MAG: family 16 glycosylhydrolase [Planctomycetota bacterium]